MPRVRIDAVVVSTCTGYLCPGLSGHVVERLGLRPDVQAFDLVGQGCAAALPNLMLGHALLAGAACEHVLSICVEISSAAMYLDNDPGVLISACLFGDGAGAAVLSRQSSPTGRHMAWKDSTSLVTAARVHDPGTHVTRVQSGPSEHGAQHPLGIVRRQCGDRARQDVAQHAVALLEHQRTARARLDAGGAWHTQESAAGVFSHGFSAQRTGVA